MRRNRNIYPVMPIFRRGEKTAAIGRYMIPYNIFSKMITPYDASLNINGEQLQVADCPLGLFDMALLPDDLDYLGRPNPRKPETLVELREGLISEDGTPFSDTVATGLYGLCLAQSFDVTSPTAYTFCALVGTYAQIPNNMDYVFLWDEIGWSNITWIDRLTGADNQALMKTYTAGQIPVFESEPQGVHDVLAEKTFSNNNSSLVKKALYMYDRDTVRIANVEIGDILTGALGIYKIAANRIFNSSPIQNLANFGVMERAGGESFRIKFSEKYADLSGLTVICFNVIDLGISYFF